MTPYISLTRRAKLVVVLGAAALFFYNLLFAFTMPVVLPSLLERYGIMQHYALLNGMSALLMCIATPLGGRLGDRFGRRRVGLLAAGARLAFMIACAVPTSGALFFALYLCGNAVGGLLNGFPYAILSDVTTQEERPKWFGLFGTVNGVALLIGLLGGGIVVDLLGPLVTFLFFAPFGLLSFLCLLFCYPNRRAAPASARMDVPGMLLLSAGLAFLITWCNFGGTLFRRLSPLGVSLLLLGLAAIVLLVRHEGRAQTPLFDPNVMRSRHFLLSSLTYLLIAPMMCLCSSTLALFGQVALGLSATVSGTLALPKNILFFLLPSLLGAWIARDQRRFRPVFYLCGGTIAAASFLCCFWDTSTPVLAIYLVMLLFGVGTSCQSVCIQPYVQLVTPQEEMGSVTSLVQFSNSIGTVLFSSVYSVLYNARYLAATQPGGSGAAAAVAETFSGVSLLSMLAGLGICLATFLLMPRAGRTRAAGGGASEAKTLV